jgi:hypothetical protein
MPYLTKRALEGLSNYAYKPSGYTTLDELHQPVWNCERPPAAASGPWPPGRPLPAPLQTHPPATAAACADPPACPWLPLQTSPTTGCPCGWRPT